MLPFIWLAIGFLLVVIEFFVPGGIIGILGGGFIIGGIILFAVQTGSVLETLLLIIVTAVAMGAMIKYVLWKIRHSKPGYSIYLSSDQEGWRAAHYDESLLGQEGEALSDLGPAGRILIAGKQYQALSQSGYLMKGAHVVVIGGEAATLFVKGIEEKN